MILNTFIHTFVIFFIFCRKLLFFYILLKVVFLIFFLKLLFFNILLQLIFSKNNKNCRPVGYGVTRGHAGGRDERRIDGLLRDGDAA